MNNIMYRYLSSFVSAFLMFFVQMLIVSKLSVENYGFYNFALSFMVILSIFSNFGLDGVFKSVIPSFFKSELDYLRVCNNFIYYKLIITFLVSLLIYIILYTFFQEIYLSFILISLFFFSVVNQFILDSIFQLTYRDNQVFYLRLIAGISKLVVLIVINNFLPEDIILYFMIIELLIFMYIISIAQPISGFDKSFAIFSHFKKSYHFNLNVIFDLILTVSTGIWILKLSKVSYVDIGYFAFIFNIVIICSDRFSPLSKLESYMTNFYLINFRANKLMVENTFSLWFKLGIYYIISVCVFFMIFFTKLDLHFFESKYSFLFDFILLYLLFKSVSQLCYTFTAKIIYHEKYYLFSYSSIISIVFFFLTLLIIMWTDNFSYKTLIIPFCLGYLSKTVYLFLNSYSAACYKVKREFYFKTICLAMLMYLLNYLNIKYEVIANIYLEIIIYSLVYISLSYHFKILTKRDLKILLNTGNIEF